MLLFLPSATLLTSFYCYYIGSKKNKQKNQLSPPQRDDSSTVPKDNGIKKMKLFLLAVNRTLYKKYSPATTWIDSSASVEKRSIKSAGLTGRQRNSDCVNQLVNQEAALINSKLSGGWNSSLGFGNLKLPQSDPKLTVYNHARTLVSPSYLAHFLFFGWIVLDRVVWKGWVEATGLVLPS